MIKNYTTLFLLFVALPLWAQVTLKVTATPANTPAGATIYVAGNFNGWNPADPNYILTPDNLGNLQITIPQGTGTAAFKFTRGSWATVEGNATGNFLPDRTFSWATVGSTLNLTILSWEDLGAGGNNSTAAANVSILSTNFFMPQLNRNRRIWLYLPPDYQTSTKEYPVLYMQDGQNLFDAATSFSGEWQVDETLNSLFAGGDYGAIVVGIDNGGGERLNEYSPWNNPQYGGGQGALYIDFIAETLKPYIDANYRTLESPETTAIIGSSMGALISTYGALAHPESFGKVGALSPAYWFSYSNFTSYIDDLANDTNDLKLYFVAGNNEYGNMVTHVTTVRNKIVESGTAQSNTLLKFDSYGTHTESYWRGEFGALYTWLFANENLGVTDLDNKQVRIQSSADGALLVSNLPSPQEAVLYDLAGRKVATFTLENGLHRKSVAAGIYVLVCGGKSYKVKF
ncbi:alpha/beta hydrolase [Flavobacterium sp.]|uniref:alpha/beta hydrolase n=1 Tax=Flavobacterium sp. TaxID=239 RepID=UPI003B996DCE